MDHFLQLVDVHFLDVLLARGPLAILQADHAAHDFHDALHQQECPGDRDDGLERVDDRAFGGDIRTLADRPRFSGVVVAGPDESHHSGNEEKDVQREVKAGLQPRRKETVEHVAAHMPVLRERVGAGHHEQRSIHPVHHVEGPGVRVIERIARENFP